MEIGGRQPGDHQRPFARAHHEATAQPEHPIQALGEHRASPRDQGDGEPQGDGPHRRGDDGIDRRVPGGDLPGQGQGLVGPLQDRGPLQRLGLSATVGNADELLSWLSKTVPGPRRVIAPPADPVSAEPEVIVDWVATLEYSGPNGQGRTTFAVSVKQ